MERRTIESKGRVDAVGTTARPLSALLHAGTHPGRLREENEDTILLLPEAGLAMVADGMGGHAGGGTASRIAAESFRKFFTDTEGEDGLTWPSPAITDDEPRLSRLVSASLYAHNRVIQARRNEPEYQNMGSTVVALHLEDGIAFFAHVGDSRCYLLREGALTRLTRDHTLMNDPIIERATWLEELEKKRRLSHILTRCLGVGQGRLIEVDRNSTRVAPGDRLLLCSDGLSDMVDDVMLAGILHGAQDPAAAVRLLVNSANIAGGRDNISAVVIEIRESVDNRS